MKDKSGTWIGVQPVEGALVMNIGDVLQRWSNGMPPSYLKSEGTNDEQIILLLLFIEYIFRRSIIAMTTKMGSVKQYRGFRFRISLFLIRIR